jgi:hypothetical protein
MGVRRAQERRMEHAGLLLVVHIAARAGHEARILEPAHRLADAEFRRWCVHRLSSRQTAAV